VEYDNAHVVYRYIYTGLNIKTIKISISVFYGHVIGQSHSENISKLVIRKVIFSITNKCLKNLFDQGQ
jgi:hypothetical protein